MIRYERFISCNILYKDIDPEINYLSTYEDELTGSIISLSKTKYNTEVGKKKFPLNTLQVNYSFEI